MYIPTCMADKYRMEPEIKVPKINKKTLKIDKELDNLVDNTKNPRNVPLILIRFYTNNLSYLLAKTRNIRF